MTATEEKIQLPPCWKKQLSSEFSKDYMLNLKKFLVLEYQQGKTIYPARNDYFSAFNHTLFDEVKVVIIGQDPYHGPNQAHGLCFSVKPGVPPPPSLLNIYKELNHSLNMAKPCHGDLTSWAQQGVLLLNSVLTVEKGQASSHRAKGWERFTDEVIRRLNDQRKDLVFLLWGNYAQQKGQIINPNKHLILQSTHPSPLSASRGFLGCNHFIKTNEFLAHKNIEPILWALD